MSRPCPGKHIGHRRNQSSDRTLALQSFEPYPKTPLSPHLPAYVEEQLYDTELSLDPSWDEAHAATGLAPAARAYLADRHGTLALDPMPAPRADDPLNWPRRRKAAALLLVACHACLAGLGAAAAAPALRADPAAAAALGAPESGAGGEDALRLDAAQVAALGLAPLAWRPLADAYGRRPVFLLGLLAAALGNVGCALSSGGARAPLLLFFRVLVGAAMAPAGALGPAVAADTFLRRDRARALGVWTAAAALGVPAGPLAAAPLARRAGLPGVFWALAAASAALLVLHFFLGPETLYVRGAGAGAGGPDADPPAPGEAEENLKKTPAALVARYVGVRRVDPRGITAAGCAEPLRLAGRPCAALPALACATAFLLGSVLATVEAPPLLGARFGLGAEEAGLQLVGAALGCVLGEQVGGSLGAAWMRRAGRRAGGGDVPAEARLWLGQPGYALAAAGVAVFLVAAERGPADGGTVVPVVGTAVAAMGSQLVTTVLVAYAVDCAVERASSVGVLFALVRQLWWFLGPFWFPPMFASVGLANSSAVVAGLITALGIIPTLLLQWRGQRWR